MLQYWWIGSVSTKADDTIFVRVLVSFISLRMVSHITKIGSTHPQPRGIKSANNSSIILIFILLNFCFIEPIHLYNSSEEQKVTSEILFLQNKCVLMLQRYKKAGIYSQETGKSHQVAFISYYLQRWQHGCLWEG